MLFIIGCKKDEKKCDYYPQSKLNVYNGVNNTYYVYVDGTLLGTAYHNTTTQDYNNYFVVSPGSHSVKMEQIGLPSNTATTTINAVQCEISKVTTP
jgi:hypothetical protein